MPEPFCTILRSAVQIIPNILDEVSSLTTFIRSKTWITAGFAQRFAGVNGANFKCPSDHSRTPPLTAALLELTIVPLASPADSDAQREILRNDPKTYLQYRKNIESELNSRFRFILNGSEEQAEAKAVSRPLPCCLLIRTHQPFA